MLVVLGCWQQWSNEYRLGWPQNADVYQDQHITSRLKAIHSSVVSTVTVV